MVLTGIPNYPAGKVFPGYGFWKKRREDYHGIEVRRVPLIARGNGGAWRLMANYFSFVLFACLLGPAMCRGKVDRVLVYEPSPITVGLPALLLKKLKRAPLFFWVQDLWPESLSATGAIRAPWLLKLVEYLVRFIYRGCDRILVQSRAFCTPITNLGVTSERILYFPNSAEELYQPVDIEPDAKERGEVPDGFRVMFAGNIGKAQDFDTILAAAELLKVHQDIHWVVLGDGRMFGWVKEQIDRRRLGDSVHLLGRHPVETMPRYFALADVMLVTLRREAIFALTIPAKVQSYLACSKPLIAALDGEGANIVREAKAGLTPRAEDPRALADAVLTIYGMSDAERREMGLRGRRYFEAHFERDMLLKRLDDWLKEAEGRVSLCAS
jgi:colanic acid biosynthesis glycosyl transferase WcaI